MAKEIRKRILAILMTLAMMISIMPVMMLPAQALVNIGPLNAETNTPLQMTLYELSGGADLDPNTNGGIYYFQIYSRPDSGTNTAQLYTSSPGDIDYISIYADQLDNNYPVYFIATQPGTYTFTITLDDYAGNLIESSITVEVNDANAAPTVATSGGSATYAESSSATVIDSGISISDSDGDADWNGGKLLVQITANNSSADILSLPTTNGGRNLD